MGVRILGTLTAIIPHDVHVGYAGGVTLAVSFKPNPIIGEVTDLDFTGIVDLLNEDVVVLVERKADGSETEDTG